MRKCIILGVLLMVILVPCFVRAQSEAPKSNVFLPSEMFQKSKGFLDSLIDPSRFSMSQSYTMSFYSIGNQSFNQGLYLNTMNFQVSNPLMMQVRIGYLHQPLGGLGTNNGINGKLFLQRAMLQYKPTETMSFTIDYQVFPSSFMSPYYYRW